MQARAPRQPALPVSLLLATALAACGGAGPEGSLALTAPAAGAPLSGVITLEAALTGPARPVELLVDGAVVASAAAAPYQAAWDSASALNGSHQISARAAGAPPLASAQVTIALANPGRLSATPAQAAVSVEAGQQPASERFTLTNLGRAPIAFLVACEGGTPVPAAGSLAPGASAPIDVVAEVALVPGLHTVACATGSPPQAPRPAGAPAGAAADPARATFALALSVGPDATPPAVTLAAPAAGASITGVVALAAEASDAVGVAGIALLIDGQPLAASAAASAQAIWDSRSVADGPHQLEARAVDQAGNAASAFRTVSVENPGVLAADAAVAESAAEAGQPVPPARFTLRNAGAAAFGFAVACDPGASPSPAAGALAPGEARELRVALPSFNDAGARRFACTAAAQGAGGGPLALAAVARITPDATPPQVSLSAPVAGELSGTVALAAAASDAVGVAAVDFLADGVVVATAAAAPWRASWATATWRNGPVALAARARDAAGNSATSAAVAVTVRNLGHLTLSPAQVPLSVEAGQTPAPIDLLLGNDGQGALDANIACSGGAAAAPASLTLAPGEQRGVRVSLPAWTQPGVRAIGCTASSAVPSAALGFTASVTVTPDRTAPAVALTSPAADATLSGTAALSAAASDALGVTSVDFLVDGAPVATSAGPAFAAAWNTLAAANGAHALQAVAHDAAGNDGASAVVQVTVAHGVLGLAPSAAAISAAAGQPTPPAAFTLANSGAAALSAQVACDGGAAPSPASTQVPAGGSMPVSVALASYAGAGTRTVTCTATTADGAGGPAVFIATVTVTAAAGLAITWPASGSKACARLWLTASTPAPEAAKVEYFLDGASLGVSAAAAFGRAWDSRTAANGAHALTAVAQTAEGAAIATSPPVALDVANGVANGVAACLSVHLALGVPDTTSPADDSNPDGWLVWTKRQYAHSHNATRKSPNWVSWELDAGWLGSNGRTGTWGPDPYVPRAAQSSASFAAGYDRGHLCPSADRTLDGTDNDSTFVYSNQVPQASNNNQGPWEDFEGYLRGLTAGGAEVFVLSGPLYEWAGAIPTTDGQAIPSATWKVVLVLPAPGMGAHEVTAATRALGFVVPNCGAGMPAQGGCPAQATVARSDAWDEVDAGTGRSKYCATVRSLEQRTGLDFFSEVPRAVQDVIETAQDPACSW